MQSAGSARSRNSIAASPGAGLAAEAGAHRLTQLSMMLAAATAIWLLEATMLPSLPIPGAKFGFANVVTLLVIVGWGLAESAGNVALRVVVGSLITGTLLSPAFVLAIVAGTVAALAMYGLWRWERSGLSLVGISVAGSVVHTLCQLVLAAVMLGTWMVWLQAPVLVLVAVGTGCFNGLVAWRLAGRLGFGRHP